MAAGEALKALRRHALSLRRSFGAYARPVAHEPRRGSKLERMPVSCPSTQPGYCKNATTATSRCPTPLCSGRRNRRLSRCTSRAFPMVVDGAVPRTFRVIGQFLHVLTLVRVVARRHRTSKGEGGGVVQVQGSESCRRHCCDRQRRTRCRGNALDGRRRGPCLVEGTTPIESNPEPVDSHCTRAEFRREFGLRNDE